MADGPTAYERRLGETFDGPSIPFGAKDSYKPPLLKASLGCISSVKRGFLEYSRGIVRAQDGQVTCSSRTTWKTRQPPNFTYRRSNTKKSHKKEHGRFQVLPDLSHSSLFLDLAVAKGPQGDTLNKMNNTKRTLSSRKKTEMTIGRCVVSPSIDRHEVHRSNLYTPYGHSRFR